MLTHGEIFLLCLGEKDQPILPDVKAPYSLHFIYNSTKKFKITPILSYDTF